jgi:transcriptional regulator with XRE-family HTH domain
MLDNNALLVYNTIMIEQSVVDYNHLKEYLLPKLEELGMSVEQFARAIGKTRTAVYYYLHDKNRPVEEVAAAMAHVLNVPVEEVLRQYTPRRQGRPRKQQ